MNIVLKWWCCSVVLRGGAAAQLPAGGLLVDRFRGWGAAGESYSQPVHNHSGVDHHSAGYSVPFTHTHSHHALHTHTFVIPHLSRYVTCANSIQAAS